MQLNIPDISKQIHKEDILGVLKNKYSSLGSIWVNHQMEWSNKIYAMFKDHEKAIIVIYLLQKTLDFYTKHFVKLSYEEYYSNSTVEIGKFNIIEISNNLNIPKETARRKLSELEKDGIIIRDKKKSVCCTIPIIRPDDSIKRISNFLYLLSQIMVEEKILLNSFTTEELKRIIEKDFSYIWKIYYDMQIKMMLGYKKTFKDYETFHIFSTCVVNQHLYANKMNDPNMNRKDYIKSLYSNKSVVGVNAMSISDITNIPRATVIRKLKNLLSLKYLSINKKKHYTVSGNLVKKLITLQNQVFNNLANFSTIIFNSAIL